MSGRARMGRSCFRERDERWSWSLVARDDWGSLVSHPFRKKKRKGWGTEAPGDRKIPEWLMEAYRFPMSQKQGHGAPMVVEIDA
jgi:hypothetical protein